MAVAELVVNVIAGTADFKRGMAQLDKQLTKSSRQIKNAGRELSKLSVPIGLIGGLATKSSIEFESAFAGVKKTVDGTPQEFKELAKGIKELSTEIPVGTTELARIAEAAGQLGVEKENILDFAKTMSQLGTATNLSSTEAAEGIAKFINVTGLSQDKVSNLGSSIVALGNSTATTERDILAMAQRIAAAGQQANLSDAEILALSASLSSVGLEAEAGGTAMSKLILNFKALVDTGSSDLAVLDEIVKDTGKSFKQSFEEDASQALLAFFDGLKKTKDGGESILPVIEQLGIKEDRLRNAVLSATEANDEFRKGLVTSKDAFEANTALSEEASRRYETLASQLLITKNQFSLLLIEIGDRLTPVITILNEKIQDGVNWFRGLSETQKDLIVLVGGVVAAIGPAVFIFGTFATNILSITRATTQLAGPLTGIVRTVGILSKAVITGLVPAIAGATKASLAFLATPIGLAIAALGTTILGVIVYWDDFKAAVIGFSEAASEAWQGFVLLFKDTVDLLPGWMQDAIALVGEAFQGLIELSDEVLGVIVQQWDNLVAGIQKAGEAIVKSWEFVTGRVSSGTVKITAKQEAWIKKAEAAGVSVAQLKKQMSAYQEETDKATESVQRNTKTTDDNSSSNDKNTSGVVRKTKAQRDAERQTEELRREEERLIAEREKEADQLEELNSIITGKTKPNTRAFREELERLIDTNPDQTIEDLNEEIIELAKRSMDAGVGISEIKTEIDDVKKQAEGGSCLLYTSPSPRDQRGSRMPSSA